MFYSSIRAIIILVFLLSFVLDAAATSGLWKHTVSRLRWKRNKVSHTVSELRRKRSGISNIAPRNDPVNTQDNCTHGPTTRGCWSEGLSIDTNPDLYWPETGKTIIYDFEITNATLTLDGVPRQMAVVNGQYPGPTIVADWGDIVQVRVKNSLVSNGTGLHFHGLRQLGTNLMDGVGGVTECPLAPQDTRIYTWQATQYGSSWYHSHYSVQYGDGVLGGIVIRGPATSNYDIDLGVMPFTDWFHSPIYEVNAATSHSQGPPPADNILVNGSMTSPFGGQYAVTVLEPGKRHLLRLMNTGINNYVHVGLDDHPLTVVAADFVPIVPYTTTSLVIAVGQRYDVIITANQTISNYWLRVGTGGGGGPFACDGPNTNAANTRSIFHYTGANNTIEVNTTGVVLPLGCYDETNLVPYMKKTVPQQMPERLALGFANTAVNGNLVQWLVDGKAMMVDLFVPTIQNVVTGNLTFGSRENLYDIDTADEWQYWVIQQDSNITAAVPHPVHLHGHDFYVLDQAGNASWSGDISRLKTDNPIRRDTATLPAKGYLVLAFESDNPGIWLMHCHVPFHISAGLGLQFLERKNEIDGNVGDYGDFQKQCQSWSRWVNGNYSSVVTGDSLLKRR